MDELTKTTVSGDQQCTFMLSGLCCTLFMVIIFAFFISDQKTTVFRMSTRDVTIPSSCTRTNKPDTKDRYFLHFLKGKKKNSFCVFFIMTIVIMPFEGY